MPGRAKESPSPPRSGGRGRGERGLSEVRTQKSEVREDAATVRFRFLASNFCVLTPPHPTLSPTSWGRGYSRGWHLAFQRKPSRGGRHSAKMVAGESWQGPMEEKERDYGAGAGAAVAGALAADGDLSSRARADAFLEEQTRLTRLQIEDMRAENRLRHWSL